MSFFGSVKHTVSQFLNNDLKDYICVIGGSNIDVIGTSLSLKKRDSSAGKISLLPGGVARNIAENLGRLGVPTMFVSAIGSDAFGSMLTKSLTDVGVYISGVRHLANKGSSTFMAILDDMKDVEYSINDVDIISDLNREWIQYCEGIITGAKSIVLDCNLRHEAMDEIFSMATSKVYVSPVSTAKAVNIIPHLSKVWAMTLTLSQVNVLTGITIRDEKTAISAMKILLGMGVKKLTIDMGDDGLLFAEKEGMYKFEYNRNKRTNKWGSDDAFLAIWTMCDSNGEDSITAIKKAIVASQRNNLIIRNVNAELSIENLNSWYESFLVNVEPIDS